MLFAIFAVGLGFTLLILSLATLEAANPGTPTVNGLFYGDGDKDNYKLLGSADAGRGSLYFKRVDDTLYLAVVVSNTVNDNVFGDTGDTDDKLYLKSAGWKGVGNQHHTEALINSDNTELKLQCGNDTYEWIQGYLYDADGDKDPHEADWLSDPLDGSGGGAYWPTVLISSASSLQWNLNNAATYSNTTWAWDVTLGGNRSGSSNWKSPDDVEWLPSDNDVTNNGYPTWDATHQWEWAMVYEMSIDVSACGGNDIIISVPKAHNSPPKDGTNDVPICYPTPCSLPASIGDYVWIDTNGNGIQDAGESGLDGVTVRLYDSLGSLLSTTSTSGGGFYSFTNLSPGDYYVEFVLPSGYAFTSQDQGSDDAVDSDADTTTGKTAVTTLVSGETDLTWDAGLHRSFIGDRVWYDEDETGGQENPGTGFDDQGFNGVDVYLYSSDGDADFEPGGDDFLVGTTTTASGTSQTPDGFPDGIYGFDMRSLGPGQYWVWVDETDLPSLPEGYHWVSTTGGDHQLVSYTGGDDFSFDFGYMAEDPPTAVTLSSFAAQSSAGSSASRLWLGLAGLTVLAVGSVFWTKRWAG